VSLLRQAIRNLPNLPDVQTDIGSSGGYWSQGMVFNGDSSTVTTASAMRLSAVFACLRLLSEAIATLPLDTFRRQAGS
jgi:hypothetical protein